MVYGQGMFFFPLFIRYPDLLCVLLDDHMIRRKLATVTSSTTRPRLKPSSKKKKETHHPLYFYHSHAFAPAPRTKNYSYLKA
jgi:hypothetical protein